jgi:AcrR family transcriptional regulator
MDTAFQAIQTGICPTAQPGEQSRGRILAAAADILRTEPDNFSLQRVARRAGISARAVYGHFESGAELACIARLSTLNSIVEMLPTSIGGTEQPEAAVRQFALSMAAALQSHGSAWLLLGRQDAQFRAEYRRSLRLPLVRSLNSYLVKHRHGARLAKISNAQLAELLVTAIESVVVNHDDDLALALECNDAIDHLVRAIFEAYL